MTMNDKPDMRRPVRTRSREQFRADLVEVARRLFLARGVHATSMADIGRELGVSKPTVYEAFESKHALIDAVFRASADDLDLGWILDAIVAPPPFPEFLDLTAESYKLFLRSPRSIEVFQLVIREGMHSNEMLEAFGRHLAGPSRAAALKIVAIAIERGECANIEPVVVQRLMAAPMYFLMVDRAMSGEGAMTEETAISYIDHSFAALKTHLCGIDCSVAVERPGAVRKFAAG